MGLSLVGLSLGGSVSDGSVSGSVLGGLSLVGLSLVGLSLVGLSLGVCLWRGLPTSGLPLGEEDLPSISLTNLHDSFLEALLLAGDKPVGVPLVLSLALVVGIHVGAVPMRGSNSVVLLRFHSKTHTAGREREYDVTKWL